MTKLDRILRRYKERTENDPSQPVEMKVLERINAKRDFSPFALMVRPEFRRLAVATGLVVGIVVPHLTVAASSTESQLEGLAVFSTDAPFLPTSWLG